jgi:hypothetical protein
LFDHCKKIIQKDLNIMEMFLCILIFYNENQTLIFGLNPLH